jgi:hypothetical protein
MRKLIILLVLMTIGLSVNSYAQYGFGTNNPNQKAIIDASTVTDKGFLIPKVALTGATDVSQIAVTNTEADKSLMIYNTATAGTSPNQVSPGFYYWNGTKWMRLGLTWFFMPAIKLDLSAGAHDGTNFPKVDLYAEYIKQFNATGTPATVASTDAPSVIPFQYSATDFYYYVTYYDNTVISGVSIDGSGNLSYTVSGTPTSATFMNIIFVVK